MTFCSRIKVWDSLCIHCTMNRPTCNVKQSTVYSFTQEWRILGYTESSVFTHAASIGYSVLLCCVKARAHYSDSVIRNPTPTSLRKPLEPSQFSVRMSDTQCDSPPNRSYMLTTNHVNSVGNKVPKLFKSYLVFY